MHIDGNHTSEILDNAIGAAAPQERFATFAEFYPFYLSQHRNRACRRMHVLGTSIALTATGITIATGSPAWMLSGIVAGYGSAWIGHLVFEKNKPASWDYFLWSFFADWVMLADIARGRVSI